MIRRGDVIQYPQSITFRRLEQPVTPTATVFTELEQELALMAAVREVSDVTWQEDSIGARHPFLRI